MADSERGAEKSKVETAILVGCGTADISNDPDLKVLDELAELAKTADTEPIARVYQKRSRPDTAFYVGKGKADEITSLRRDEEADVVIFDVELTPRQLSNLEEKIGCRVLDRSEVIIDIFATHARSQASRLQVELAQLRYTRPRLKRMWTHLSRIAGQGGIGSRGPGEKQIETDRRLIDRRLNHLEQQLQEIKVRKERQVKTRSDELTMSLIGYTNAGKSTLMNCLTDAAVFQADMLFATLDTKTSDFELPSGQKVLISDTVGFIKNLPHHLVASFHATLEEVRQAKLLLHVVDAASPGVKERIDTVHRVLYDELKIGDHEELVIFNKIDRVEDASEINLLKGQFDHFIEVSAKTGEGIDKLLEAITEFADRDRKVLNLSIPAGDGKTLAELNRVGEILDQEYIEDSVRIRVRLALEHVSRFEAFAG
ncbi:MAG: GTPase HflX [Planctomycetota bacterium]